MTLQTLEGRCLLSVSIEDGVLTIVGTKRDDAVTVQLLADTAGSVTTVDLNGRIRRLSIGRDGRLPRRIIIDAGSGDDWVKVSPLSYAGVRPLVIRGGPGDDVVTITNGLSIARINGGSGNDIITAFSGRGDKLSGGSGNDLIQTYSISGKKSDPAYVARLDSKNGRYGSEGSILRGGDGDDTLIGSIFNDRLVGGTGHDALFGDEGKDTLKGGPGNDRYPTTHPPARRIPPSRA